MTRISFMRAALAVAVLAVSAATSFVIESRLFGGSRSEAQSALAESDAEWIQVIRDTKASLSAGSLDWPQPVFQPDVKVLTDCRLLPAGAAGEQMSIEQNPDGKRSRTIEYFTDPATRGQLALVLTSDQDLSGCDESRRGTLLQVARRTQEIDKANCEQMTLMAAGKSKTDPTLRDASPAVAKEYLDAFCR